MTYCDGEDCNGGDNDGDDNHMLHAHTTCTNRQVLDSIPKYCTTGKYLILYLNIVQQAST